MQNASEAIECLRFKALFLGLTDGVSQMLLDFALIGEKGKKGNFGMSAKELSRRYTVERTPDTPLEGRVSEYAMNKIALAVEMTRRAVSRKVRFRYVLADSWFTCAKVVKFIYGGLFRAVNQDSLEIPIG